jgi:hypothetical protein
MSSALGQRLNRERPDNETLDRIEREVRMRRHAVYTA